MPDMRELLDEQCRAYRAENDALRKSLRWALPYVQRALFDGETPQEEINAYIDACAAAGVYAMTLDKQD